MSFDYEDFESDSSLEGDDGSYQHWDLNGLCVDELEGRSEDEDESRLTFGDLYDEGSISGDSSSCETESTDGSDLITSSASLLAMRERLKTMKWDAERAAKNLCLASSWFQDRTPSEALMLAFKMACDARNGYAHGTTSKGGFRLTFVGKPPQT